MCLRFFYSCCVSSVCPFAFVHLGSFKIGAPTTHPEGHAGKSTKRQLDKHKERITRRLFTPACLTVKIMGDLTIYACTCLSFRA